MTHPTHAALAELSIDERVNIRRTNRGAEPIFAASIRQKGILVPLIVRPNGNGYKVVEGGKRLAALRALRDAGEMAAGIAVTDAYPVPITVRDESDVDARDTSLITNIVRAPTHAVDRYEAFSAQVAGGRTPTDLAATYALSEKEVRQVLALGALAPEVRQAWREGAIDADTAQAFTLEPDLERQAKVLAKLQKGGDHWAMSSHNVRRELVGDRADAGHLVEFECCRGLAPRSECKCAAEEAAAVREVPGIEIIRVIAARPLLRDTDPDGIDGLYESNTPAWLTADLVRQARAVVPAQPPAKPAGPDVAAALDSLRAIAIHARANGFPQWATGCEHAAAVLAAQSADNVKLERIITARDEQLTAEIKATDAMAKLADGHATRVASLKTALAKINDIRNSIIGAQTINWSEHIYPLVAALEQAGIEGLDYPEARRNVGTLLERNAALEVALQKIINLQDRSYVNGEALIMSAITIARAAVPGKEG